MSLPIDAKARARLARMMSIAALLLTVVLFGAFIVQAGMFEALAPQPSLAPLKLDNPDQITATDSTVAGLDRERQPFELTARSVVQDRAEPRKVHLDRVSGTFRRARGDVFTLSADRALYDTEVKELELEGNVQLEAKGRFTATMAKAYVVVDEKKLTANVPVTVKFSSGTILGNGLEITHDGRDIRFFNRVTTHIAPTRR